jgi:molybdenum cofactor biosynthesis enzyme MoaA
MQINRIANNYPSDFVRIEYMLGNLCNYKCNYCFPGSNEGTVKWPDVQLVMTNVSHLLNFFKKNGKTKFQFYLIGGEPTLWKDLPILTSFLKEQFDATINISTNGSRKLDWWIENSKHFDDIEISVHHEFADVTHIKNIADEIYEQNINVVANVLMDPVYFNKCKTIIEELQSSKNPWPIIAKTVHYNGESKYQEPQKLYMTHPVKRMPDMDWYKKVNKNPVWKKKVWTTVEKNQIEVPSNNWFTLNKLNYFKGWNCNLGIDHIEIFQDGSISGNCRQKIWGLNFYQNLYDENFIGNFKAEFSPVTCEQSICQCTSEIIINKHAQL